MGVGGQREQIEYKNQIQKSNSAKMIGNPPLDSLLTVPRPTSQITLVKLYKGERLSLLSCFLYLSQLTFNLFPACVYFLVAMW